MRLLPVLLFSALGLWAGGPPIDVVLLLQDSANHHAQHTDLRALQPGDRIAVMTLGRKTLLRVPFTTDHEKAAKIVRAPRNRFGISLGAASKARTTALWDALIDAGALFADAPDPARRRAVVVLFTDEDRSSRATPDTVRRAFLKAAIRLNAAIVAREEQVTVGERNAQTPPVVGPAGKPVETRKVALPEATMQVMQKLASDTQGNVEREEWDLTHLMEQIRRR